ncbi:hypothetical protein NQ314_001792 [Rhamnusium bicolor]|uniref:Uncharacterized protein n=1 Tax=Rhamnusium bicolor TaxID=1586634 RepID=A0AAV8ZT73_9CUCU|nr:hypothetical protein NQ314_001792 [Rhamnusium bicolor]
MEDKHHVEHVSRTDVYPYEVTTQYSNGDQSVIFDLPKNTTATVNDTKSSENKTRFTMERITQPSQTEQIERTLESLSFSDLNSSLSVKAKKGGLDNFKPSPQIETYYEFNKFPVEPALPEAKTFGNVHEDENTFNSWTEKPVASQLINKQNFPTSWVENPREHNSWFKKHTITGNPWVDKTTTEQAWVSRIKFPQSSYASVNERPYKFITNNAKLPTYAAVSFPVTTEGFSFNKPVETSNKNSKPTEGFWEKLMGYGVNKNGSPKPAQKTSLDYNLLEKPPHLIPHKEYQHGVSNEANPWKKITKLLTAVIPIGLLISALTPTVITVTSLNDT